MLIARYWLNGQRDAVVKSAKKRFLDVPDNLIAFVCNGVRHANTILQCCRLTLTEIETALADIATGVHQFTNKVYAPK